MSSTVDDPGTDAGEPNDQLPALKSACQEGRQTVDRQVEWIRQNDRKAIRVLRTNLILAGLLLTALSLLVRTDEFAVEPYVNLYTGMGIITLLGSTVFAAITYVSSGFEGGIQWTEIDDTVDHEYGEKRWYERLALGYSDWIEYNALVLKFNAILSTTTILLVIDAVVLLTAGILVGRLGIERDPISYGVLLLVLVVLTTLDYVILKVDDVLELYHEVR